MAEITADAYTLLKKHIVENWTRVILFDDKDNNIVTIDSTDSRFSWIHATKQMTLGYDSVGNPMKEDVPDSQTLKLEIVLTGSDSDVSLDTTFAKIELNEITGSSYENPSDKVVSTETFTNFTISKDGDKLTVTHEIEVPQVK
ncbi:hypothetical protein GCM10008983_06610 [Lentibacillus halophilus]|uniref:Uncharacterized protein n=1 Tax=Lentibacillus halophilus TaxID=295065 RepID=A0ABN0Z490_9BACI